MVDEGAVLVIEDRRDIRNLICRQLESLGYLPIDYSDGESLISGLETDGDLSFRMALIDLELPGRFSGVDVIRELKEKYPDRPLVAMSGRAVEDDSGGGYWTHPKLVAGSSGTLSKPYRLSDLRKAVETNISRRN